MAKNTENIITRGLSGKFANVCFQKNGVIRKLPDRSNFRWTPLQAKHHEHFESAKEYARHVVADAEKTAYYTPLLKKWKKRCRLQNVGIYQLAICDFSHPPEILRVEFKGRPGKPESRIAVFAHDNFQVTGVHVSLFMADGTCIEEGEAMESKLEITYNYPIQHPDQFKPGSVARIRVWDVPGNITEKYFQISVENEIKFVSLTSFAGFSTQSPPYPAPLL